MTTNYEKKLLNEIKELKEGSVPREILFADRAGHRREIAALQKENEELKRNGGFVGDYATAKSANALLARQKDSELKKLKEENEKLKNEMEKRLLETQFNTWHEGEIDKNGEVDPAR